MLPAADFDALLVRPSRNVFDAALAAFADEVFFGALRCDKALPEDVFVDLAVLLLRSVFDADEPAFFPVTFLPMINLLVLGEVIDVLRIPGTHWRQEPTFPKPLQCRSEFLV